MNLTEAQYKAYCKNKNIKYDKPKENKLINIESDLKKRDWDIQRKKKPIAQKDTSETFIIIGNLPGLNQILNASNRSPFIYGDMKKEYTQIVMLSAKNQLKFNYNFIDISITWIERNKQRDKDNIAAGTKFILDGLVKSSTIKEDGWNEISNINHNFKIDKENPRIEIKITEKRGEII